EVVPAPGAPPAEELSQVLAALVGVDASPNPTVRAVAEAVGPPPPWQVVESVPFSSARKYSGAAFAERGSWLLGAPDVLLAGGGPRLARAGRLAAEGRRVLVLARAAGLADAGRSGVALVVLEQRLRPAARDTLRWFAAQDVAAKVISGDNAASVGAIARQLG